MAEKLLLALIAAMTAVVTSLLTYLYNVRKAKEETKANSILELEVKSYMQSLKSAMVAIQDFKDQVQITLNAKANSLSAKEAIRRLAESKERLYATYKTVHPDLKSPEAMALHSARNLAEATFDVVLDGLNSKEFADQIPNEIKADILQRRNAFTEYQDHLRECRLDMLERLVNGVTRV